MYLTKAMISGAACRNPYELHRVLWKLFPEDRNAGRDFLFRVERSGQQMAEVLVQSHREPIQQGSQDVRLLGSKPYPLTLRPEQRLHFLLLANPIKTINDEGGRLNKEGAIKKCRVPLIRDEDLKAWLVRKLDGLAMIEAVEIEKRPALNFRKSSEKRVGKVQPVSFRGVLSVVDPDALADAITRGIGSAKAFGCGLLSLARA